MQESQEPLLDSLTSELRPRGVPSLPWLLLAIVVAAFAVLFFGGWVMLYPRYTPEQQKALALQETVKNNNEFASFADVQRAKAEWLDAQTGLTGVRNEVERIAAIVKELENLLKELETSEEGRRIAGDQEAVSKFVAVRDARRPNANDLNGIRAVTSELTAIANRALKDAVALGPDRQFNAHRTEIEAALVEWGRTEQHLSALKTLIKDTDQLPPTDKSLADAVKQWEAERDREHLAELAAAQEQLQAEMAQRLQIETIDAERKAAEAKLKTEAADADMQALLAAARAEQEQAIVREAQEKLAAVRLRFKLESDFQAALPEIRSLLSPAVSRGRMQLGGDPFGWYQGEEGPLSLAQLKRFGALQPNKEVLLGTLFCGPTSPNDRPFGSFPERVANNNGKFKRAHDLLIKYGELMVEHGLLNP